MARILGIPPHVRPPRSGVTVGHDYHHDTSRPLWEMAGLSGPPGGGPDLLGIPPHVDPYGGPGFLGGTDSAYGGPRLIGPPAPAQDLTGIRHRLARAILLLHYGVPRY